MLSRCAEVTSRPATPADDPYLRALFGESRPDLAVLPEHLRAGLIDLQYRAQRAEYERTYPRAEQRVLVADGTDVGRLIVDRAADVVRIVDLVVHPSHRRQGIATAATRQVITEAGSRAVALSVWCDNMAGRALYERLGFAVTGDSPAGGYLAMERRAG